MKKIFIISLLILQIIVAKASDFEVDGIEYSILSLSDKSVCVTQINQRGDIVIPDSVVYNNVVFSIDSLDSGFTYKSSSIMFNSLIKTDGYHLFGSKTSNFYVDESNPYMTAIDGVLYSKDLSRLISYPSYKECEEFIIPDIVKTIDNYSFSDNKCLVKLIFNDNIEELPEYFAYGTSPNYGGKLKYLKLSDRIKEIPYWSVALSLETIILPRDLEVVFSLPYWSLTNVTIPNSGIVNLKQTDRYTGELTATYVFSTLDNLKDLHVLDSNPVDLDENVFTEGDFFTINLYVPIGAKEIYQNINGWKNFFNIIEEDNHESERPKCATPTISLVNGQLMFDCETEDVTFVSSVICVDNGNHNTAIVPLTAKYKISVYAKKDGYDDSDIVTKEISIRGLKGDVNEDGEVNIADINTTIGIILGQ